MLKIGDKAPNFTLPDQTGAPVSLGDFAGRTVVLYFYPKDSTPGCTRQACAFRAADAALRAMGVQVLGISKDSVASHQRFAEKNDLPFPLLSDPQRQAIEAYGVWQEKKNYGKVTMGVVRTTFVIGPDGTVQQVFERVKPDTNAEQVLAFLRGE